MAYQLTVLYNQPADKAAFDKHYDEVHIPLAMKMPGVRGAVVSRPGTNPDGSEPLYHVVTTLTFDSAEALAAATNSEEGKAAVADLQNFASAGVTLLSGPARSYT